LFAANHGPELVNGTCKKFVNGDALTIRVV
jgi:hypothetical protein